MFVFDQLIIWHLPKFSFSTLFMSSSLLFFLGVTLSIVTVIELHYAVRRNLHRKLVKGMGS